MPKATNGPVKQTVSHRQKRFVMEYLKDLNGTQAVLRAGYSKTGASVNSCRLLSYPKIQQEIALRRSELKKETGITQQMVIEEYKKIAFLDPSQLVDNDGNPLPINKIPKEVMAAVCGFDVQHRSRGTGEEAEFITIKKYRLSDKVRALSDLAKHLGMFTNKEIDLENLKIKVTIGDE